MPPHARAPHPLAEAARRLQPALRGTRVLLVGDVANRAALKTLVRLAGARVMAASDPGIALSLMVKFPIDMVIGEPDVKTAAGEAFESAMRRCSRHSAQALWIELPKRMDITHHLAFPQLRLAESRGAVRRGTSSASRARPRSLVRRAS